MGQVTNVWMGERKIPLLTEFKEWNERQHTKKAELGAEQEGFLMILSQYLNLANQATEFPSSFSLFFFSFFWLTSFFTFFKQIGYFILAIFLSLLGV